MPVPTEDSVGALVKTSASGPMPTSRYWLQAFCSISTCFSCIASVGAGLELGQIVADQPHHFLADRFGRGRIAARPLLDHALQHRDGEGDAGRLQRLQVDRREQPGLLRGRAHRAACWRRWLRDRRSARPLLARKRLGRVVLLAERADGRKRAVTSNTPSLRTATTAGPFACGSQTRPTSVPFVPSSGRRSLTVNVVMAGVLAVSKDRPLSQAADPIGEDQ